MTSYLRPEEQAAYSEMERAQTRNKNIGKAAKAGVSIASTAAGIGLTAKIAPFLSQYVPLDLAVKGISKVAPKVGEFLKKGQSMGLNVQEGLNYLKGQISSQNPSQPAKEQKNIIEQESPELFQFMDEEIRKGREPLQAGALAQNDKRFTKIINKLTKDHKTPWSSIVRGIFGIGTRGLQEKQQVAPQPQEQGQVQGLNPQLAQLLEEGIQTLKNYRGNP